MGAWAGADLCCYGPFVVAGYAQVAVNHEMATE